MKSPWKKVTEEQVSDAHKQSVMHNVAPLLDENKKMGRRNWLAHWEWAAAGLVTGLVGLVVWKSPLRKGFEPSSQPDEFLLVSSSDFELVEDLDALEDLEFYEMLDELEQESES